MTFPNSEVDSHSRSSFVITHTATTHTLDAKFRYTERNISHAGQTLGLCSGWPSCIWLQPQGEANGNLCHFLHQVKSNLCHFLHQVAPVSHHAPPSLGEPLQWRLSPLCKCRAVRSSFACNRGRFTKATRPYTKGELSTCIKTVIMTQWSAIICQDTAM